MTDAAIPDTAPGIHLSDAAFQNMVQGVWRKEPPTQVQFVEHFRDPLFGFIRLYERDAHRAEDALQETFFAAFRKPIRPELPRSDYKSMLFGIARHKALDSWRKQRRQPVSDSPVVELIATTASDPSVRVSVLDEVLGLLDRLPLVQRTAVYLSVAEGWTDEEIASLYQVKVKTVRSRRCRGRSQLRRQIEEVRERERTARGEAARPQTINDRASSNLNPA